MKLWLMGEKWENVHSAETANRKAEEFQETFSNKYTEFFPKKLIKVTNEDQPWITQKLKKLDRQRRRVFHKNRRSERWKILNKAFKHEVKLAKKQFYKNMVEDLKVKNPGQWYSAVKRMASYDNKAEQICVDEVSHLSDQAQCEHIADEFSEVPNNYSPLHTEDIAFPPFSENDIPQFTEAQVWKKLACIKINTSTRDGDAPARLYKTFAAYLADPLTNILNCSIKTGQYPDIWKVEVATPIPKTYPTSKLTDLRNISGLMNSDKIFETLLAELIMCDMQKNIDPSRYGNMKGKSINHYLIDMINRILTTLDNSKKDTFAVVANLIDWSKAFPRQCPRLGVDSFIRNGVRPALIPVLASFFPES